MTVFDGLAIHVQIRGVIDLGTTVKGSENSEESTAAAETMAEKTDTDTVPRVLSDDPITSPPLSRRLSDNRRKI